jgi:hypothetical protein
MEKMEKSEIGIVKLLHIMSILLLDSPYVRFLQALITNKVCNGQIDYYKSLEMYDVDDNFQMLGDGRINESYYKTRKARFIQRLLIISDEIYSKLEEFAQKESLKVDYLWQNCNFKSMQVTESNTLYKIIEEGFTGDQKKTSIYTAFALQHETAKRLFAKDKFIPSVFQEINSYLVEALYLISFIGMYDFYVLGFFFQRQLVEALYLTSFIGKNDFYALGFYSQRQKEVQASQMTNQNESSIIDMMLNPSTNNILNYLSSVDLSKDSRITVENIKSYDDLIVYFNHIFYPFGILLSEYEKYISIINKSKGKEKLKNVLQDKGIRHLGAVYHSMHNTREDLEEYIHNKIEFEKGLHQTTGEEIIYNPFRRDMDYNEHRDKDNPDVNFTSETSETSETQDDVNQEIEKLSWECQLMFRTFPVFDALKSYKLKGSPYNLVAYIRTCIESEFVKTIKQPEGLYSNRLKEKFSVGIRTIQRYEEEENKGKEIDYAEKQEELTALDIEVKSWRKERNQKHQNEGYLSQNELADGVTKVLNKEGIKCSSTTVRNIIKDLRENNLIAVEDNDKSYSFKDDAESLKNIYFIVKQKLTEKVTSKKSKKKGITSQKE